MKSASDDAARAPAQTALQKRLQRFYAPGRDGGQDEGGGPDGEPERHQRTIPDWSVGAFTLAT
jgi:hypothetical protein